MVSKQQDELLPLIAEGAEISKRTVETGRVRVRTRVVETEETVQTNLQREEVDIERVPINEVVKQQASVRQEGDVTIVPIYEEC